MALAEDFDTDGDLDIAAISFFPDFVNGAENSFLFFENRDGEFTAFRTPLATSSRWITLESADVDRDGDRDLLLGALAFPIGVPGNILETWRENQISLLVLKNNRR